MPSRTRSSYSAGHRVIPLCSPWVNEASQNPPLRPVACSAIRSPSSSSTERPGSRSTARSAVQRPQKPPPTTTRSTVVAPSNAGRAAGRSGVSSQSGVFTESARESTV